QRPSFPPLTYHHLHFFLPHTPPPHTYTLSLHDALPIYRITPVGRALGPHDASEARDVESLVAAAHFVTALDEDDAELARRRRPQDRKSTRLNSSHQIISYAVFCLKKKKNHYTKSTTTRP